MTKPQASSDFQAALGSMPDLAAVKRYTTREINKLGFDFFAYVQLTPPPQSAERLYIGNYPFAWSERYRLNHLDLYDPLYTHALTATEPYFWDSFDWKQEQIDRVLFPASEYGLRAGVGIPCRTDDGTIAGIQFVINDASEILHARFAQHQGQLLDLAGSVHERVTALVRDNACWDKLDGRMYEVLTLVARGQQNNEIGELLGIQTDTARQHVGRLTELFGVRNRTELGVKAAMLKLVIP